jgi:hypothetical protein
VAMAAVVTGATRGGTVTTSIERGIDRAWEGRMEDGGMSGDKTRGARKGAVRRAVAGRSTTTSRGLATTSSVSKTRSVGIWVPPPS